MRQLLSLLMVILSFGFFAQAHADPLPVVGVMASSAQAPNVPANTLDGDLNTRWSARGDGQMIQYQLETCEMVSLVRIAWYQGDTRTSHFAIDTSEDGIDWAPAHSGDSSGTTLALEEVDIEDRTACFVRIVGFGNTVNAWNSITEVEIHGAEEAEPEPPGPPGPMPILGVTASDAQEPNVPENVIDGNLGTRWSALGAGQWIEFDLGEEAPMLNQVSIAWLNGDARSSTFGIEVSIDGLDYTTIYGGYSSGTTANLQPYAFAAISARYVRIVGFGNSQNDWNSITEVELMHVE